MAAVPGQSSSAIHPSFATEHQESDALQYTNTARSYLDPTSSAYTSLQTMSSWTTALFTKSSNPTFLVPSYQGDGRTISAAYQLSAIVALTVAVRLTKISMPVPRSKDTTPSSPVEKQYRRTCSPAKRTSHPCSTASFPRSRKPPNHLIHPRNPGSTTSTPRPISWFEMAPSQPA